MIHAPKKTAYRLLRHGARTCYNLLANRSPGRQIITGINLARNQHKTHRKLEIGPGPARLEGFETLNIRAGRHVDYICDAAKRLPLPDECFEVVYASHVLEHIPWYQTEHVLREWTRILKPGGVLEIWVPDGEKICKAFIDGECDANHDFQKDGWYRFNEEKDVCKWAAGRLLTYGDGTGDSADPNWHRALFSRRYLKALMERVWLLDVTLLDRSEVRGDDHGWINLGMRGRKP
ncbi:MAG: methyltransferase domain-containing protein [Pirellulales bacterium]|nr:methyltransferase domain-containing protein [Pirellulales bacterium]